MEDFQNLQETIVPYLVQYGLNIIFGIILLLIGWMVANWVENLIIRKGAKSERLDDTLSRLFAKTGKILILAAVVIAVLGQFGVQTASLIAVIGALGLAIGLAWQGVLADFAAGIMILVMRPFKVNEAVNINGTSGVVDDIGLVVTKMHTFDNLAMSVPNSEIWGNVITNFNTNDTRRVDMEFGFGYDDDMDQAMRIVNEILDADERVLAEPEPLIVISELGDSSVTIRVRPWVDRGDYWPLKYDVTKRIKERFDEEGLNIPYPQHDVHLFKENSN